MDIKEHSSLKDMTTFRIGGEARYLVDVSTEAELIAAFAWAKTNRVRFVILGGGSNMLVSDTGFDGLVIRMRSHGMTRHGDTLVIDAGRGLTGTIQDAGTVHLGGWEKLAGIPGTVGGAVRGNAGAFGSEIKDFVVSVRAIDSLSGAVRTFDNAECAFSYRDSFFKRHPEWVITQVTVVLKETAANASAKLAADTIAERERRHLQNVRAAGSFFMNPVAPQAIVEMFEIEKGVTSRENRVPAGWLIEKAGFKGAVLGGARASFQHPNYLVNESGSATAGEVVELAETIKQAVREQFGIELVEEASLL